MKKLVKRLILVIALVIYFPILVLCSLLYPLFWLLTGDKYDVMMMLYDIPMILFDWYDS